MVSITILYEDLTSLTVPVGQINDLPKDNVLFIKLRTDTREGKLGNISQIKGFDNYAVLTKRDGGSSWYMLYGWDEDDYIWRRECSDCVNRVPVDAPIGTMHVMFRGIAVSNAVWQQAVTKIDNEL